MLPITTNFSPFCANVRLCIDARARQWFVVLLGATFEARDEIRVADEQMPLFDVDVPWRTPGISSVRYDADLADQKQAIDLIVNGQAVAPDGRSAERVPVGILIEGRLKKLLTVIGDRFIHMGRPSSPKPFQSMPVIYERSFGGSSTAGHYAANPVGIGYRGARSADYSVTSEVPNIEHPFNADESQRLLPPGFGVIARGWAPRLAFGGRYDQTWIERQFPLIPSDFDPRFHQAAPADQQIPMLKGGEIVHVVNMTPEGRWTMRVPKLTVPLCLRYDDRLTYEDLRVDTLLIEPDHRRLVLRARARIPVIRNAGPLVEVVLGNATPAWWIARVSRKHFRSGPGRDGRAVGAKYWQI